MISSFSNIRKQACKILSLTACCLGVLVAPVLAKEVVILYSGQTHAMLYPCSCPKESDGGVARRATLVKQLRKKYPRALLLDSGSFFAGGTLDEYAQNAKLDMERSAVNLRAMDLMQYDAALVGAEEFGFGEEVLKASLRGASVPFLSCDILAEAVAPFILKDAGGIKVGIIGVSGAAAASKAPSYKSVEPKKAVAAAVAELKGKKADIIVLLSQLGDAADTELVNSVQGIDVVICGGSRAKEEAAVKIGDSLFLRPVWQGRKLSKVVLNLQNNKVNRYNVEEIRLSEKIADDMQVSAIRPHCFADGDCKKSGLVGICQDPGELKSRCLFSEANKVTLQVVTPKDCLVCETASMVKLLKKYFPGLVVSYLYYPQAQAKKLVDELSISGLPAYLIGREVEAEEKFSDFKNFMELKGNYYVLKPQFSGLSYFRMREKKKGSLDVFISLYDKNTAGVLQAVRDFDPNVHFLVLKSGEKFDAPAGNLEVEEDLRAVCVRKIKPEAFWDYLTCRANKIDSSWWQDCAGPLDAAQLKSCARSGEGRDLLLQDAALNEELAVMLGPVYLLDNQQVFSTKGAPKKEELRKIIKR